MYKQHPVFESPQDLNTKIWRYIDFTKFVSLLDKSALYFSRADKLGDPFEGSFSKVNVKLRPEIYKDKIPQDQLENMSQAYFKFIKFTFINCWHLNEYESAAMWKLYLKSNEGISIRSTFSRLKECFKDDKHDVYIGKVKYIDYEKDWLPEGNLFYPFVHKRKSFEHEQELRAVVNVIPPAAIKNETFDLSMTSQDDGIAIKVDLDILIESIYVAPTSPPWLFDLVRSVSKQYKINKEITQSSLDEKPVY
jgi:hypothetical protein